MFELYRSGKTVINILEERLKLRSPLETNISEIEQVGKLIVI